MATGNDRRDYNIGASQNAQDNFNRVASRLEALIEQRNADVNAAMSDYQADGVSDEYRAKEQGWRTAADEVKGIIATLRSSMEKNDGSAQDALSRGKAAVNNIG
ncbi:pore-forming ESAT-6 family protein [Compostimonas suwonensis]|uniref:Pore-forming ESAT-6 family protein n=1 Tax=Compostimonas suwonensis TaxID=1048394 RepID=A0A2M9C5A1_9MICO|nr:pore-forming ESAT-6 family protein [Compostimonas suwonensis]PJJ65705.1 hypothetical protein CLV54_0742 [Compostimonas suwonensis]